MTVLFRTWFKTPEQDLRAWGGERETTFTFPTPLRKLAYRLVAYEAWKVFVVAEIKQEKYNSKSVSFFEKRYRTSSTNPF